MSGLLLALRTATAVPLDLTISQEGVGGVTGKSPTVAIRDASTLNSFLDFNSNTFKTSGWGEKYQTMQEVERGHYQRAVNLSAVSSLTAGQFLSIEYHVDDGASVIGDDADLMLLIDSLPGTLSPTQNLMLLEMYELLGLNPAKPLVVGTTYRRVPATGNTINQVISESGGIVTVTRT